VPDPPKARHGICLLFLLHTERKRITTTLTKANQVFHSGGVKSSALWKEGQHFHIRFYSFSWNSRLYMSTWSTHRPIIIGNTSNIIGHSYPTVTLTKAKLSSLIRWLIINISDRVLGRMSKQMIIFLDPFLITLFFYVIFTWILQQWDDKYILNVSFISSLNMEINI